MIGILPAAGKAERIYGLPKYLLPVEDSFLLQKHIKAMKAAGCNKVLVGANPSNCDFIWDYADGAYVYEADNYKTMTETVLSLRYKCGEEPILFGMPDSYWKYFDIQEHKTPYHFLASMISYADVFLYCCQVRWKQWQRGGMVDIDPEKQNGNVSKITDKPEHSETPWIWSAMLWQPTLWTYLHPEDPHVGYGVQRAVEAGLHVHAVVSWNDDYYDCGTPDEYFEMIRATIGENSVV